MLCASNRLLRLVSGDSNVCMVKMVATFCKACARDDHSFFCLSNACLVSFLKVPHDVAELITYSRLSAARGGDPAAAGAAAAPLRALQQLPEEAADALIGEGCCSSLG